MGGRFRGRRGRKLVFLDVDGVLHSTFVRLLKDASRCFDPKCMNLLREVVTEAGADVVLSSNWRLDDEGWRTVNKIAKQYGIRVIDKTPVVEGYTPQENRVREICRWISDNDFTGEWVAVDDMDLLGFTPELLKPMFVGHFVRTEPRGLVEHDVEKILQRLSSSGMHRTSSRMFFNQSFAGKNLSWGRRRRFPNRSRNGSKKGDLESPGPRSWRSQSMHNFASSAGFLHAQ